MNPPKCDELNYIHFLIAAQKTFTCIEAAKCSPESQNSPAHDAFTRLLQRQSLETEALWQEAERFVEVKNGQRLRTHLNCVSPKDIRLILQSYNPFYHGG